MRSEGRRATLEDVTSAMKFFLFLNEYGSFGRLGSAIIADSRLRFKIQSLDEFNREYAILNLESIPAGLYTLIVTSKDGTVFSEKLLVE